MSDAPATRLRRSLLFVPGSEPKKLERARESVADTLLLDLEDAVAPQQKDAARENVAAALRSGAYGETELAVRVNAPRTPWFEADLEAVVAAGATTILLPKAEERDEVARVATAAAAIASERERDGRNGAAPHLLLLVESPRGVANALALGEAAAPAIDALCFGHADFCLEMGLREADATRGIAFHARCQVAIAARAAGVAPIDCVHLAVKDEIAFREDALRGRSLGFEGKLCIHPRQAEIANEVYAPTAEEIDRARRIIEAAERAQSEGRGVFELDGKMIDAPIVALERRVLERARRGGRPLGARR
jgi:citrate lyase subunit beta/citryl-CoA lyase